METLFGIQLSETPKVIVSKPEDTFGKILYFMTGGLIGDKLVFQQYNVPETIELIRDTLSAADITNIIYLGKDYTEVFNEKTFDYNDIKDVLDKFIEQLKEEQFIFFQNIEIQLLHRKNNFNHYIRVLLHQNHAFSEYPITIEISTRRNKELTSFLRITNSEIAVGLKKNITEILKPSILDTHKFDSYTWEPFHTEFEKKLNPDFEANSDNSIIHEIDPISPVAGIMLGVTKKFDIEKNAKLSDKWSRDVYILNDINFIPYGYDIRGIIMSKGENIPNEIEKIGFSWKHSFNSTIKVLQKLGSKIYINQYPSYTENESKLFEAEILAVLNTKNMSYNFNIDFKSEQLANADTPETISSILISAIVGSSTFSKIEIQKK